MFPECLIFRGGEISALVPGMPGRLPIFLLPMNSFRVIESNNGFLFGLCNVIALSINGKTHRFDDGTNVAQVLERLELNGKRLALEKNGEIVPRGRFKQEMLRDGDKLEIVVAVGGG